MQYKKEEERHSTAFHTVKEQSVQFKGQAHSYSANEG